MLRKASAAILAILILTSHFSATLIFRAYGAEETDAPTALKFIEEELRKGKVPSSSITEACFIVPEGFPVELAQRLWFFIAQLVSIGSLEEEIRRTIKSANNTLKLPARIDYDLKDYTIIPEYEKIYVRRGSDGSVSVEIPYKVVGKDGNEKDVSSIKYESNGTNVFHILHRYPKKRTYLVRCIDPDSYTFTFIDLETGKIFNKTARMKIGLFSNLSQGYFVENFVVAVPGHFEETLEAVKSQVSKFRVPLPAYDPIIVDTTISSTRVGIGDTITITARMRNPQETRGSYQILLGARFSDSDAFEAWAPPPGPAYLAPLYLRAKKPGTYTITVYFAVVEPGNLDLVFWNGGKTVTYTVEVLPEPPRLEVKLSSQVVAKYANLTITLLNRGGRKARDVKLLITGDVDRKELEIGTIVGLWSKNIVTKLLSPIAKLNITVVYYDEEEKMYASTALTTISTTNFVAPEEWRTYVVNVEGYNETKRVFVPGYQGATHVKLYFMTTDTTPAYLQDFNGVELIPISPDGFTLTIENASDISKMTKTLNVRYALIDVKPGFLCERMLREDEVKKLFGIPEDEKLEPSKIPSNYEVKLLKEEVLNQSEVITVNDEFYEWLKYNGLEDYDYKYGDIGETKWDLDKAATKVSHRKEIELIYHPLAYGGGDLVQGVLIRNYATCNAEYELEVFAGPIRAPPEKHVITVPAFGSTPLHLIQLEEDVEHSVFINLRYGDRVVATLQASFRKGEPPMFWRGFWDGFVSKGWGIVVTCGIMIIVGFVLPPKWAAAASLAILATGIATNMLEIWTDVHNALAAMDSLNGLADVCEGRSKEFNEIGMAHHANELSELSQILRLEARDINDNLLSNVLSNLALDVSWDEIRIAFGLKEPPSTKDRDYRVGYATGRVVGAIVSCAAYVTTFYAVVNRIKAERAGGKPLTVEDVLRIVGRGIWNWMTPAIFDALMLRLKPSFHKVADLLLGNKYSRKFGDVVEDLIERINNPSKIEDILETASEISKHTLENVPSGESSGRILNAISTIIKHYSLEEFQEKGGIIVRSIVSMWIKDGDDAIESLNNWLNKNTKDPDKIKALDEILIMIKGDARKGVGIKIGKIIDNYFDIKGKYDENVAGIFLTTVLENPDVLDKLVAKISSIEYYKVSWERLREVTLEKGDGAMLSLGKGNDVGPGIYKAKIYWEYGGKKGVVEFSFRKDTKSSQFWMPKDCAEGILNDIGVDEATIKIVCAEIVTYIPEMHFPKKFSLITEVTLDIIDNKIKAYDESDRMLNEIPVESWSLRNSERGAALDVVTGAKDIYGEPIIFTFYEDGRVYVHKPIAHPISSIKVYKGRWIIEYRMGNDINVFTCIVGRDIIVPQRLEIADDVSNVEGHQDIGLKERIFLSGYYVQGLEKVDKNVEFKERLVLIVCFIDKYGEYKYAYCFNPRLTVKVPEDATKIAYVEVLKYADTVNDLAGCLNMLKSDPENTELIGQVVELWVEKNKDLLLNKFCEETGIPRDAVDARRLHNWAGNVGPDFQIEAKWDITDKYENPFKKGEVTAIVEVKGTAIHDPTVFDLQVNKGRKKLTDFLMESETARYGVLFVLDYDIWSSSEEGLSMPESVGNYKNPYIEITRRG